MKREHYQNLAILMFAAALVLLSSNIGNAQTAKDQHSSAVDGD